MKERKDKRERERASSEAAYGCDHSCCTYEAQHGQKYSSKVEETAYQHNQRPVYHAQCDDKCTIHQKQKSEKKIKTERAASPSAPASSTSVLLPLLIVYRRWLRWR